MRERLVRLINRQANLLPPAVERGLQQNNQMVETHRATRKSPLRGQRAEGSIAGRGVQAPGETPGDSPLGF